MKVLGALESAQIEWFTSGTKPAAASYSFRVIYTTDTKQILVSDGTTWLPSNITFYTSGTLPAAGPTNTYQVAFITDTLQVKVSNGTVWTTIGARLDTYTSGTIPSAAANTNQIIWVSDLQQVQISNGTSWVQVGSASGLKNYFSQSNANPNFETNSVSPWSACTLTFSGGAPSGAPTLSATQMALSVSGSSPLSGSYSMLLTKAAANAQYQGFISGALTIDREDTAKVLYGSFSYEVVSGTVDFSGTSTQTYEIWIYNTVSGAWSQPAGYRGMNQSSGQGKVTFSFQTDGSTSNNSYKIAVITQQTGTGAIVVKFDSFQIGPSAIVLGAVETDWVAYTPTLSAGFGTVTGNSFFWRRIAGDLQIQGTFTTGTVTTGLGTITLPSGLSIDSSKISVSANSTSPGQKVGDLLQTGTTGNSVSIVACTASSTGLVYITDKTTTTTPLTPVANVSTPLTNASLASVRFTLPIAGWSSNVQMSSDTDTRVVSFFGNNASTQAVTANVTNIAVTTTKDSHGAWSGSLYTIPVSGDYTVGLCSADNAASVAAFDIYVNSSVLQRIGNAPNGSPSLMTSLAVSLKAGDTVALRARSSITLIANTYIYIFRLSGPSVIASTDTVACRYTNTAGTSIGTSDTQVPFATKDFDLTNSFSSPTFTVPISGKYSVSALTTMAALTLTTTQSLQLNLYKNGSFFAQLGFIVGNGASNTYRCNGSSDVSCIAGDTLSIYLSSGVAGTLNTTAGYNYMSIKRVGN